MDNETREMLSLLIEKFDGLDQKFDGLSSKVHDLDQKVHDLDQKFNDLSAEVHGLRGVLENETNRYIKIIAEAHQAQVEKINSYINTTDNVKARQALTEIRLSMLENDMKILKGTV